jgi:hypothetical protein
MPNANAAVRRAAARLPVCSLHSLSLSAARAFCRSVNLRYHQSITCIRLYILYALWPAEAEGGHKPPPHAASKGEAPAASRSKQGRGEARR